MLVFVFFEVLPHVPVGVSEVHLILGTTLFLLLGAAPAAIGLAAGLLVQGLFFAPFDLPQYGMNVTTLLVPLFAIHLLARRVVPATTAYVDLGYSQVLKLSVAYQGGIVAWVAFWAIYGQGFSAANLASIGTFGAGLHDGDPARAAGRPCGAGSCQGAAQPAGHGSVQPPPLRRGLIPARPLRAAPFR